MKVEEYFHLSPMRSMDDVVILNHMCSSMSYPHIELPLKEYSNAKVDLPPFDVNHRLVASIVVVELGGQIELTIRCLHY